MIKKRLLCLGESSEDATVILLGEKGTKKIQKRLTKLLTKIYYEAVSDDIDIIDIKSIVNTEFKRYNLGSKVKVCDMKMIVNSVIKVFQSSLYTHIEINSIDVVLRYVDDNINELCLEIFYEQADLTA